MDPFGQYTGNIPGETKPLDHIGLNGLPFRCAGVRSAAKKGRF
jgi:hypothetical protein